MEIQRWTERGLNSFQEKQWFAGIQYIQGGLQRAFQSDQPEVANKIYQVTSEVLFRNGKGDLFCKLVLDSFSQLRKKHNDIKWIAVFPSLLTFLNPKEVNSCRKEFINKIITDKNLREDFFIKEIHKLISEENYSKRTKSDLYFISAGLLCSLSEYVKCYEVLTEWIKEEPTSPKILIYLTLAELNAFEVDGQSEYLIKATTQIETSTTKSDTEYVELGLQLFKSVELQNYEFLISVIEDYNDIISIKQDPLLKALCDGLIDFLKPKNSKGMFSLFG